MKKSLLSLVMVAGLAMSANAQLLYDQEQTLDGSGIVSTQYTGAAADTTIKCADDFTIPTGGTWMVDRVTVHGFRNGTGPNMTNMTVEIYDNSGTTPGTMIYNGDFTVDVPCPQGDTAMVFSIPTQTMTEGTYWVSVYGDAPNDSRWNWATISGSFGAVACLIDPDDYFGAGATSWTAFSAVGLTATDLSFSIGGTGTMVSIAEEEQISVEIYPNPATEQLTIQTGASVLKQATIYDVNGQLVISHVNPMSNNIDVSDLPAGIYFIEITTADGVAQERFVKK